MNFLNNVRADQTVKFYNFVNAYDCSIGEYSKIGSFVEIQDGVKIGKRCKISSHSFICSGVEIDDECFIGHHVVFTNDKYPKACENGKIKNSKDFNLEKTIVKKGASIGSNSTILCGITIGKNAIVGAGSVVTKDVPDNAIVKGNPAK